MDLTLKTANENSNGSFDNKHVLLQTDPTTLLHVADELERALTESRSRHSRRMQHAFTNK